MTTFVKNKIDNKMHNFMILIKASLILCITWCTELFIGFIAATKYIPENVGQFFEEIKTPLACVASFVVILATMIKIIKENKK